jgi:hypothetical protein
MGFLDRTVFLFYSYLLPLHCITNVNISLPSHESSMGANAGVWIGDHGVLNISSKSITFKAAIQSLTRKFNGLP